jgi:hypothetical protein
VLGLREIAAGQTAHGWRYFAFAAVTEAAFYGLLRPSEALAMSPGLVSTPEECSGLPMQAIVAVTKLKNRRALGKTQFAAVRSESCTRWLRWLLDECSDGSAIWPLSYASYRRQFRDILGLLGLESLGYTPASLRAGGATYWHLFGVDPGRLKFWGRWASEKP